tara:strand:+ start:539 stop:763 length:225 start_codon:yes stop_codon:yes gene_type:complete
MQKIINLLAVLSFVGTAGVIGGGTYIFLQKDTIIDGLKKQVTEAAVEGVSGALPGLIDAAMPELPTTTGPAVPF